MSEHSNQPDDNDKTPKSEEHDTGHDVLPPLPRALSLEQRVKVLETEIEEHSAYDQRKQITQSIKRVVRWGGLISVLVSAATIAQAVTSCRQLAAMRDQNTAILDANETTRGQLAQMELDQRPWISISRPLPKWLSLEDINLGRPVIARFMIKNSGKTPAILCDGTIDLIVAPRNANTDDLIKLVASGTSPKVARTVVAPNSSIPYYIKKESMHHFIDPEMFDPPFKINPPGSPPPEDHGAFWLVGALEYVDSADKKYGPTECCFRYDIDTRAFVPVGPHNGMK